MPGADGPAEVDLLVGDATKASDAASNTRSGSALIKCSGQPAPKEDVPESGRTLLWPSPTRANEFIAHVRGLAPAKKDDAQAYDVLVKQG